MNNVVRVFFRDRAWQVSVFIEDHYKSAQTFGNDMQLAVNYAKQKAQEKAHCLYQKYSIDGQLESEVEF